MYKDNKGIQTVVVLIYWAGLNTDRVSWIKLKAWLHWVPHVGTMCNFGLPS